MNILNKKIGIIGGGQLGKMMILDAKRLGIKIITLDPSLSCPSHSISDEHIVANFDDEEAIINLAKKTDVLTYEFEHISVSALKKVEQMGYKVYPTVKSLEIIQNKYTQKQELKKHNILVPEFESIKTVDDIYQVGEIFGYPMMLKACTGGYDGKGNGVIKNKDSVFEVYKNLGEGKIPLMVERFVEFEKEISVLACRGIDGDIVVYPVGENIHIDSILDETIVPANISNKCTEKAMKLAHDVMEVFHGVGMFCVEMFVGKDENVYINEVAPRPHNSGHYTIEACLTSQFEQHIRAILGLPLGDVSLRTPVVMKNILGEINADGKAIVLGTEEIYKMPKVKLHIYGKEEVKPKRKMGHLTVCGNSVEEAVNQARKASEIIRVVSE